MLLVNGEIFLHVVRRAEDHRDSLVDVGWLDIQDIHGSCCGQASCLLYDKGHGVALIQQPQLEKDRSTDEPQLSQQPLNMAY